MANPIDDGGPAFPVKPYSHANRWQRGSEGMALRDYFAGQALIGIAGNTVATNAAVVAYEYADAMIAQRKKD